jgi:peptidoglycan-associated lipoprotein
MRGGMRSALLTFGSVAIVVTLSGCAGRSWQFWKASPSTEAAPKPTVATAAPLTAAPATPHTPTTTPAPAAGTAAAPAPASSDFANVPGLGDLRFKPGLVTVGKADLGVLDGVARWLKENPGSFVRIEGHTDDLGTPAENLAVGQKRAASAMTYLISTGLDPERISIVSYGSDRPVCTQKSDACRAKNRRAHFLVKRP